MLAATALIPDQTQITKEPIYPKSFGRYQTFDIFTTSKTFTAPP